MVRDDFEKRLESDIKYSFKIAYNGTDDNKETHTRFSEFAKSETDNSYILALKRLLERYDSNLELEELCSRVSALEVELFELKEKQVEKRNEGPKTFGEK